MYTLLLYLIHRCCISSDPITYHSTSTPYMSESHDDTEEAEHLTTHIILDTQPKYTTSTPTPNHTILTLRKIFIIIVTIIIDITLPGAIVFSHAVFTQLFTSNHTSNHITCPILSTPACTLPSLLQPSILSLSSTTTSITSTVVFT